MAMPSKSWVGKVIEMTKDTSINIISGSDAYSADVFKGQRFKVIGVQTGNWLRLESIERLSFVRTPGIQMSESEVDFSEKEYDKYGSAATSRGIVFGLSLGFDKDKFKVVKK